MLRESFRGGDLVPYLLDDLLPGREGLVAMLKAYLDRGAKSGDESRVMCVGAALFEGFYYERFLHSWQPLLDEWGAKTFHSTDFYGGGGDFERHRPDRSVVPGLKARFDRHANAIPKLVTENVEKLLVVAFSEDEFEAVAPAEWRGRFGGVHRCAAQLMAGFIGQWANESNYSGEIAYFFEEGDPEEGAVTAAFQALYDDPKQRAHARMAARPIPIPKDKARGLDVADCIAWHWNKYLVDTYIPDTPKRPMRGDTRAIIDLMEARGRPIPIRPVTGEVLERFLLAHGCTRKVKV